MRLWIGLRYVRWITDVLSLRHDSGRHYHSFISLKGSYLTFRVNVFDLVGSKSAEHKTSDRGGSAVIVKVLGHSVGNLYLRLSGRFVEEDLRTFRYFSFAGPVPWNRIAGLV